MASRNYYVILGVASTETDQGIRAAFRALVKRNHPDRVGPSGVASFRDIKEAYDVLGDPQRRREYDDELRAREPMDRRADPARDAHDARDAHPRDVRPAGVRDGERAGERPMELTVDVALSPEEARAGTRVRLVVPVPLPCARCGGRGCFACHGQGTREVERPVNVDVPPMSGSGTTFVLVVSGLGMENFVLNVRVRVDRAVEPSEG